VSEANHNLNRLLYKPGCLSNKRYSIEENIFFEAGYFKNNQMDDAGREVLWDSIMLIIAVNYRALYD